MAFHITEAEKVSYEYPYKKLSRLLYALQKTFTGSNSQSLNDTEFHRY